MIKEFQGEHRFLSNFWPARVTYDRVIYPTVEHAYQASKFPNTVDRVRIAQIPMASKAKMAARGLSRPAGAEEIMLGLVRQKFRDHEDLGTLLLETGDQELQEGNTWNDKFWGIDLRSGLGDNRLGKILMKVRKELCGL